MTSLEVMPPLTPDEIARLMETWDEKSRIRANEILKGSASKNKRAWFCANPGRKCNGKPHDGYDYKHARGSQWPPPGADWETWLIMAGRGFGKTRTGAEWIASISSRVPRIALIGQDVSSVRQVMIQGESGLISVCENAGIGYEWSPANKEFRFENGSIAYGFSAEEPDALRGPQFGAAWADEPAHMPKIQEVWDNLTFGLRLPGLPGGAKAICTSTPIPGKWLKELIADAGTRMTRGSSSENLDNLDESYKRRVIYRYQGTRKGRQELEGEYLEDVPGALWQNELIRRPIVYLELNDFDRIVVAIDPAGSTNKRSDETGIVVVGKLNNEAYVLEDLSGKYSPQGWAEKADAAYRHWMADAIVAEKNFGGDMVKTTIQSTGTKARVLVKTATRSKQVRAEPVVALYEQNRVWHNGVFTELENEMLTWVPGIGKSPNRIDALVWAIEDLIDVNDNRAVFASPLRSTPAPNSAISTINMPPRRPGMNVFRRGPR